MKKRFLAPEVDLLDLMIATAIAAEGIDDEEADDWEKALELLSR